jgi:hypothetical protein
MFNNLTTEPIKAAGFRGIIPEFGSTEDVRRCFGIKKGTLYNLHKQRKVRGKVLRVTGDFKGVRIWDMSSVRAFIDSQSDESLTIAA